MCKTYSCVYFAGATSPALVGLTQADLENWECSIHEFFNQNFPTDFQVSTEPVFEYTRVWSGWTNNARANQACPHLNRLQVYAPSANGDFSLARKSLHQRCLLGSSSLREELIKPIHDIVLLEIKLAMGGADMKSAYLYTLNRDNTELKAHYAKFRWPSLRLLSRYLGHATLDNLSTPFTCKARNDLIEFVSFAQPLAFSATAGLPYILARGDLIVTSCPIGEYLENNSCKLCPTGQTSPGTD